MIKKLIIFNMILFPVIFGSSIISNSFNVDNSDLDSKGMPSKDIKIIKIKRNEPKNDITERMKINSVERTFAIIKPDAVKSKYSGSIINLIELNDFKIVNMQKKEFTKKEAEMFYNVHKGKPFFNDLIKYMISGSVILLELEKQSAVNDWRQLMGDTDPKKAKVGTIRKMYGQSIQANAVHGSDSVENAVKEINLFFK